MGESGTCCYEESWSNGHNQQEGRGNSDAPPDEVESLHRLSKAEVFMDDFSDFGSDFESCLAHLTKILEVCVRKRLVLSWEKSHFMVREGVVLGHIVSVKSLEVDKAKTEVIQNLPLPSTIKDLRSFLGHVGFY